MIKEPEDKIVYAENDKHFVKAEVTLHWGEEKESFSHAFGIKTDYYPILKEVEINSWIELKDPFTQFLVEEEKEIEKIIEHEARKEYDPAYGAD